MSEGLQADAGGEDRLGGRVDGRNGFREGIGVRGCGCDCRGRCAVVEVGDGLFDSVGHAAPHLVLAVQSRLMHPLSLVNGWRRRLGYLLGELVQDGHVDLRVSGEVPVQGWEDSRDVVAYNACELSGGG